MIANQALFNQSKPGSGQKPTNNRRRTFIGGALAALISSSKPGMAEGRAVPNDPFILLLKGIYQPVIRTVNLGLSSVHLNDGSYSTTEIYPVFGVPDSRNEGNHEAKAIGTFYVQFTGNLCAYDLPGGAIAMQFLDVPPPLSNPNALGYNNFSTIPHPDGTGGQYLEGTFELEILEATGVYSAFAGGHNHMVDRLHALSNGSFDEFCFCNVSKYQFP
jgi:hypothetical protein